MANSFRFKATAEGGMEFPSDYARVRFKEFLKKNPGMRFKAEPLTPESNHQRRFFEGAVVPFFTYYQDNLNWREPDDLRKAREWLKLEFNGEFILIKDKVHKVPKSTKGKLNKGFLDRVIDWMAENGYKTELLNPDEYKRWRDEIYSTGVADTYLDYLIEIGKLT